MKLKDNAFQLVVLGDLHVGDALCDYDLIKSTIEYIRTTANCYAICNGDLINNAIKTSKSDIYEEAMPIQTQLDTVVELLYPIRDKILVLSTGNHEHRTSIMVGINPLKYIATALGIPHLLAKDGFTLDIRFGTAYGMKDVQNSYLVYGIHGGGGGGRRVGATTNVLEDMASVISNADLYIHSHTHKIVTFPKIIFLYDRKRGKLVTHRQLFYNSNAFLKYGGYGERLGFSPTDVTPQVVCVSAIRNRGEMIINTDILNLVYIKKE